MPQYIYILSLTEQYRKEENWTEEASGHVQAHFERLKADCEAGKVWTAGRTQLEVSNDNNMGIVIFNAENDVEAQAYMQADPAVKNGVMQARLHPFGIVLWQRSPEQTFGFLPYLAKHYWCLTRKIGGNRERSAACSIPVFHSNYARTHRQYC